MEELKVTNQLTILSKDGEKFQIDAKSASRSGLLKSITNDFDITVPVTVEEVNGNILKKIVEYLKHYKECEPKEILKPLTSSKLSDFVDAWDYEFTNIDKDIIFELIPAANFMDIAPLLELACAKIASIMTAMDPETIKKEFDILEDMTEEEQKKMEEDELKEFDETTETTETEKK